jgi:hypothetical protein
MLPDEPTQSEGVLSPSPVLIGLVGGLAMGSIAAARRTQQD